MGKMSELFIEEREKEVKADDSDYLFHEWINRKKIKKLKRKYKPNKLK